MDVPLQHSDLGSAVTVSLRNAIMTGALAPGERLVESELATRFDVSRGPIRDALSELERSGLVEVQPRKGSFVRRLGADDIDEVYTFRCALECMAIRRIVERRADLGHLPDLLAAQADAFDDGSHAAIGASDLALHRAVVEAADHNRLRLAWEALADQTMLLMVTLSSVDSEIQAPMGAHRSIVRHLCAGRADAAVEALTHHLDEARQVMLDRLG
ncbi:MAG: GntR family transcriptional regulator [Actinomycetota bacterium]